MLVAVVHDAGGVGVRADVAGCAVAGAHIDAAGFVADWLGMKDR